MKTFKKLYRKMSLTKDLLFKERYSEIKLNDNKKRIQLLSKGFLGHSKLMYQIDKNNYNFYLSDLQQTDTGRINGSHSYLLNNKVAFEQVIGNYIPVPMTLATILNGKIIPLKSEIDDTESLVEYIDKVDQIIIKPIIGSKGRGIFTVKKENFQLFINNETTDYNTLKIKIEELDEYFISEYIRQGEFGNKLNPQTVNSMRIMTMIDPETNEAFIPGAVQRIGTKRSAPTDNFSQGGLNAKIDLESGALGQAVSYPYTGELIWHEKHPDSNQQIEGLIVPEWENIKSSIIDVATKNSYLKYIGWDVVLTDNGIMIMEGNSWPGIYMFQIHKPLLEDKRVYDFYKHHDII